MAQHPIENIPGYAGKVGLVGNSGHQVAEIDALGYLVNIDIMHHKTHEGELFYATDYQEKSAPTYWLIINNTAKEQHSGFFITSDVAGLLDVYENTDVGTFAKGTQFYGYNTNRTVGGTSNLLKYAVPLGLSGTGDKLFTQRIGAGGNQKVGGQTRGDSEIILKTNGTYVWRFTPDASAKFVLSNLLYDH